MTRVYHPTIANVFRTVTSDRKPGWLAAGWLANDPFALTPEPDPEPDGDERPRGNASRDEWETYAEAIGVEVTEDMSRDDIREAVAAAEG